MSTRICELCGKAPAEVRPAPRWGYDGWHCGPCRLILEVARRSCPPRFSLDHAKIEEELAQIPLRIEWLRVSLNRVNRMMQVLRLYTQISAVPSDRLFIFQMLFPELEEYRTLLQNSCKRTLHALKLALERERDLDLTLRTVVTATFGVDNPFEDPEFMRKTFFEDTQEPPSQTSQVLNDDARNKTVSDE